MIHLCPYCFHETSLRTRLIKMRPKITTNTKCSYHPNRKGIPLKRIAEFVDKTLRPKLTFGEYYSSPRSDSDRTDHVQNGSTLEELIYELTGADDQNVVEDLINQLMKDDHYDHRNGDIGIYHTDQSYEFNTNLYDSFQHSKKWKTFCSKALHEKRFFNSEAQHLISEIFTKIHLLKDTKNKSPVYYINPNDKQSFFYRARKVSNKEDSDKIRESLAKELGPPPETLRVAGRLNPSGISAFYCAFDEKTCIAELRPAVGNKIIVGKFELLRPICVLDMTKFQHSDKKLGVFAKDYERRSLQWVFMKDFMREISKPILPNDEHLQYIPTQIVAEYLAHEYEFSLKGNKSVQIEAIIYTSAQNPEGKNIVLIGDASQVKMDVKPNEFVGRPSVKINNNNVNLIHVTESKYEVEDYWEDEDQAHWNDDIQSL